MKKAVILFSIIGAFASCDKIEGPYREKKEEAPNDTTSVDSIRVRKVLLEDYTGHLCGNCPGAAKALDSLIHSNNGKVIPLAVHAGYFARTTTAFPYDFRTPESTALDNYFGISAAGNPNGMVNRSGFQSQNHIIPYTLWKDSVQQKLSRPADASFNLTVNYTASSRTINCTTNVELLKDFNDPLKLCVFLTEDSIIEKQEDYSMPAGQQEVEHYLHMHALRASLNSAWGESITSAASTSGQTLTKSHTYVIPSTFVDHNCNIVVFIYNAVTNEVIQADMKPVIQ
jgi:hypothetical protein